MYDQDCITFLQWALPHLQMRWPGFRRVRGQVCKRLGRRLDELQLADLKEYRAHLENNPLEFHILDSLCRITISRFYRDRGIFNLLGRKVFPELLHNVQKQGHRTISCWCIGAASGEEPYSVSLVWEFFGLKKHSVDLDILSTEVDQHMINRARKGCYAAGSMKELPEIMKTEAFTEKNGEFCLKELYKKQVRFLLQDIRNEQPPATFHLILCRNLVFTYFSMELQEEIGCEILQRLKSQGFLVLGAHEKLPASLPGLSPWVSNQKIYRS